MENADEHDPSNADSGPSLLASNASERSVSELSAALKRTLEENFSFVRVRGEVSRVSRPSSGHVYFDLKDAGAAIAAVIWKGVAGKLKVKPEQGLEVIVTGRVTTFPGQSKYQIVVESMEPAGVGALMALLEERKKKLAVEGLFAAEIKKKLPFLPKVVGVVTSPTGAVIRDILHRLSDRFPVHVIVWPVRVQGESCALEVATAIRGFNALPVAGRIPRPDVLIVARGGGSIEDLWGFNEEIVARATFESQIPIVSAVGHETDTTLIDYVADLRAPTPTAAAEFVVPVRLDLLSRVNDRTLRLESMVRRLGERRRRDFSQIVRAMPDAEDLVGRRRQQLDLSSARLSSVARNTLDRRALLLAKLGRRLGAQTPEARLIRFRERLQMLGPRLVQAGAARLTRRRDQLTALGRQLKSLSYHSILDRGFVVVRGRGGPLLRAAEVPADAALTLEFVDGRVSAKALGVAEKAAPRRAAPRHGTKQPGLFDES